MCRLLIPLWLLLQSSPSQATEPAHTQNPIYSEAVQSGFPCDGGPIKLPAPILKDGLDADAQRAAILKLMGSERALDDLVRNSVTAPFLLKVQDHKTTGATIRIIDLWFVIRGDLDRVDPVDIATQSSGKAVEAGNMRFESRLLSSDELRACGQSSHHAHGHSRWFVHLKGRLLDRVTFEATDEIVATRTGESIVVASRTSTAFDSNSRFPNRWRTIGQGDQEGPDHRYPGGLSYGKISRLKHPEGALLVEVHGVFDEPEGWFQGAPILRSKFAPIAQNQIRRLRLELLKNHPRSGEPRADAH